MESESSGTNWLAIGLALGLGICALFLLHNISVDIRIKNSQPVATSQAEVGATYSYDEKGRITSVMPVKLRPV